MMIKLYCFILCCSLFILAQEIHYARVAVADRDDVIRLSNAGFQLEDAKVREKSTGRFDVKWLPDQGFVTIILQDDTEKAALENQGYSIIAEGLHQRIRPHAPSEAVPPFQFGWPRSMSGSPGVYGQAATIGDFNNNGQMDIFLSNTEGYAYMWKPNGTFVLGFPQAPDPANVWSTGSRETAAAGDIDGDGAQEIVFGRWVGLLYAFQYHLGAQLANFPINFGLLISTNDPALYDFDSDERDELLIYTYPDQTFAPGTIHLLDEDGSPLPGWPITVTQYSESSPAIGDIDGDGEVEIVFGSGDVQNSGVPGFLHAYNIDGSAVPGFPVEVGYGVDTPPTIYDINMDGTQDILIRIKMKQTEINGIYAFDGGGNLLPGFPAAFTIGGSAHGAPAIADVNGDGLPEIAYGTVYAVDSAKVWLFDHTAQIMPGFPQPVYATFVEESVSLEDVNGDTLPDIVCGTNGVSNDPARLYAFDYQGNIISGYPFINNEFLSSLESTPAIYDVDGDGDTEIFTASISGTVFAFDTPGIPAPTSWPTYKYNTARHGSIPQTLTAISDAPATLPDEFTLLQNYPNPFNPSTRIEFTLAKAATVSLNIFNIRGEKVADLLTGTPHSAGKHGIDFNAENLPSGIYFYRLETPSLKSTRKMILLR